MNGAGRLNSMACTLGIIASFLLCPIAGTEDQCYLDCHSADRPVGPTRPWDANDALRNPLRLTRPYPYHIGEEDKDEYSFAEFCKLGCNFFFVSSQVDDETGKTTTLSRCLDQCDEKYDFNPPTPPYNDLTEMARLECRDGCQMALKRCQPGYYCLQVSFNGVDDDSAEGEAHYAGGDMIPCPAGTYRDVSYDAVTKCIPCPPNYFREDIKGRSIAGCSPCRAGTSAPEPGSDSVNDCIRCPAGKFSTEASFCTCIVPRACAVDQLPSPADAEKKTTVPYIGRW